MGTKCDQCQKPIRGTGNQTATRVLCDDCYATFAGLTAGYMAGGTVENAISTAGWFSGLRNRGKKKK
jgi:hypothetical protein